MPESTTVTTFRAVFRHTGIEGGTYCPERATVDEAWKDADDRLASYPEWVSQGKWFVQVATTTTTTEDLSR